MARLSTETLKKLVQSIVNTRSTEIGCDMCIDELAKFVEQKLDGQDVAEIMPMVKHHLDSCLGCGEEYEALIDAINSVDATAAV